MEAISIDERPILSAVFCGSLMVRRAPDSSLVKRSQEMLPSEDQGPASARAQAVRALAVIEEHVARAGDAIEHDLAEKDVLSALSALRRQVTALEIRLVKSRLNHFRGSADARQRARASEVLDLLRSRCETRVQDTEVFPCTSSRMRSDMALEREEE